MDNNQQIGPEQGSLRITWEDCCSLAAGIPEDISLTVKVEPGEPGVTAKSGWLYMIADGLGREGVDAGRYVLERVVAEYYRQQSVPPSERLRIIFRSIGARLFSRAEKESAKPTPVDLTAVVILNGEITVANAGGNRAYLIHDEQAQLITHDPTRLNEMLRNGNFTVEDAQNATRQQKFFRRLGEQPETEVDIIERIPVIPGDMLLLCNRYLARRIDDEDSSILESISDPEELCSTLTAGWDFTDDQQNIILLGMRFDEDSPAADAEEQYGEFIPMPVTPVRTHYRSAAVSPQRPEGSVLRRNTRYSPWFAFLVLMGLLGVGLLALLIANFWQNSPESQLRSAQTSAASSPTANKTGVAVIAANTLIPDTTTISLETQTLAAPTAAPTLAKTLPSAAVEGNACVWKIETGNSLYSTIRQFDLSYADTATYFYFEDCDMTSGTCQGEKKEIESHSRINAGWYVIIPVADQAACASGKGTWVEVIGVSEQ